VKINPVTPHVPRRRKGEKEDKMIETAESQKAREAERILNANASHFRCRGGSPLSYSDTETAYVECREMIRAIFDPEISVQDFRETFK
jgi:hypothetical protein